jgi:hypothetical protein
MSDLTKLPPHVLRFLVNQDTQTKCLQSIEAALVRKPRPALLPRLLVIGFALFLVAKCSAASAEESKSFYNKNGSFVGSSSTRDNSTSFSDRNGHFDGTAIKNSNGTTSLYDRNGHFTGSVVNTTPKR